jgi:hypothetical protein
MHMCRRRCEECVSFLSFLFWKPISGRKLKRNTQKVDPNLKEKLLLRTVAGSLFFLYTRVRCSLFYMKHTGRATAKLTKKPTFPKFSHVRDACTDFSPFNSDNNIESILKVQKNKRYTDVCVVGKWLPLAKKDIHANKKNKQRLSYIRVEYV